MARTRRRGRQDDDRFWQLFAAAPSPLALLSPGGFLRRLNPCHLETFGYGCDEIPTMAAWWRRTGVDADLARQASRAWEEARARYARDRTAVKVPWTARCKDGSRRAVLISATAMGEDLLVSFEDAPATSRSPSPLVDRGLLFRMIADLAPFALVVLDGEQRAWYRNDKFTEMFGYDPEPGASLERWWPQAYPDPEYRRQVQGRWTRAAAEAMANRGGIEPQECLVTCKDGSEKHIEFRMVSSGEVNVVIGSDCTARKRVEQALRESEHHYRTLADAGRVLIWASGIDRQCFYFNEPWLRFTGRTLEQEQGDRWLAGVHPADRDHCLHTYHSAFTGRTPFSMEYRLRHADDRYRWVLADGSPRYDSDGRFLGYIGHCLDITEGKRARMQARGFLNTLDSFLLVLDRDGNTSFINSVGCRMIGYAEHELIGRNWFAVGLPQPEGMERDFPVYREVVEGRRALLEHTVTPIRCSDGRQRMLTWHAHTLRDEAGNVEGIICAGNDFEEMAQADDAGRNQGRGRPGNDGQSMATLIHDLKGPLMPIIGLAQLMMRRTSLPEDKIAEYAGAIHTSSTRLAETIEATTKNLQVGDGAGANGEACDLEEVLCAVARSMAIVLLEAQITLRLNDQTVAGYRPTGRVRLFGDRGKMRSVLENLLGNAAKYARSSIDVTLRQDGGGIVLIVDDDGRGIDVAYRKIVFNKYFQIPGSKNGNGVGLYSVRCTVEEYGGSVTAVASPAGGARILVTLPERAAPGSAGRAQA